MLSASASELFTFLIAVNAAVFAVLALALVVVLVWLRSRNAARARRERQLVATWRPIFTTAYVGTPPTALPTIAEDDTFYVLGLFATFLEIREHDVHRTDEILSKLADIAASSGIKRRALRSIQHGDEADKLLGLKIAGALRDRDALPYAVKLCSEPGTDLSREAATCALRIDPKHTLTKVLGLVAVRADWTRSRVEAMLRPVPIGMLDDTLAAAIDGATDDELRRLLDYVRLCSHDAARAICANVVARALNPEAIAAALRSLAPIATNEDRVIALLYSRAQDPIVVIAALRILRRCPSADDRSLVAHLLGHRDYWVRLRAAEVLIESLRTDEAAEAFAQDLRDRFARDAIKQAIADRRALARRKALAPDRRGASLTPETSS